MNRRIRTVPLSVVLCSRDRAQQVRASLGRLDMAALQTVGGELVLVDNGSSDDTARVFRAVQQRFPAQVHCIPEPRPGLSRARNTGVRNASGSIIVFLDDDVYLADGYLRQLLELFENAPENLGVVGGRILRHDPTDSLYGCQLSQRRAEYPEGSTIRPGAIQGANFAIRRSVFDVLDGFDEALGAGARYRCEDIDFIARALNHGFTALYEPGLVVEHHHGRKDGDDIEQLRRDNSYASGAFFAKMLGLGYSRYRLLLAAYVLSAPVRSNMKLAAFRAGWKDYRAEFGRGAA